jgi:RNA polymerase sigma-70 factor, ECF subfamily
MTSEEQLIQRASRFEQAALAEIYDIYSPGVYRYAVRLLGDVQLAEECVSDTFLRYLRALRAENGPCEYLQAYLYRIAHNWITDYYRRYSPEQLALPDDLPGESSDLLEKVAERIDVKQIRSALACLTPEQREVIVLKYLEGWENELIAKILEKPVGAVKSLQHRALEALRRVLLTEKEDVRI